VRTSGATRPTVAHDLVEAARLLMWETGAPVFTVSQVVAAAGTSLKSFYRCFDSKDELLVALFEDDARRGAEALAAAVDQHDDPVERVRCAVEGLFGFITVDGRLPYAAALVREHLRLSESRPEKLRAVLQPFVDILRVELENAGRSGALQGGRRRADGPDPVPSRRVPPPRPHLSPDRRVPHRRGRRSVGLLRRRPPPLMSPPP
jgi:AcrR family transcriptional regulator